MLLSLSEWELCIDFEGRKMKTQVRYLGFYILVINDKYWLLSWQVLKILFPILQVTKIKAERLNALCSATGKEHGRAKRRWEILTINSTESCRNVALIGGSRRDRRHILTEGPGKCTEMLRALSEAWAKKKAKKNFQAWILQYMLFLMGESFWSQDFRGVGPQAGESWSSCSLPDEVWQGLTLLHGHPGKQNCSVQIQKHQVWYTLFGEAEIDLARFL